MTDTNQLIELLREEALIKQGSGINNGCVDCSLMGTLADEAADALADQQKRMEELERAVKFYADKENWKRHALVPKMVCPCVMDNGKRARAALAGKGES